MPLKLTLKPHEKVIIGGAVIKNDGAICHLNIENNVPVLRQGDILRENEATTPCKRIYMAIQLMYINEKDSAEYHPLYWDLVRQVAEAAPSMKDLLSQVSEFILATKYYQALKQTKKLIDLEEELLRNVSGSN